MGAEVEKWECGVLSGCDFCQAGRSKLEKGKEQCICKGERRSASALSPGKVGSEEIWWVRDYENLIE